MCGIVQASTSWLQLCKTPKQRIQLSYDQTPDALYDDKYVLF